MATTQSFEMALRQCRHALRNTRSIHIGDARRAFSTSLPQHASGGVPAFQESQSQDLNNLLAEVRTKVFVPGYLKDAQRRLLFRAKHKSLLLNEPFYVDIADESFQLLPLDRLKDIPNSWRSTKEAIKLMKEEPEAWDNLLPLLQGMRRVGRKWTIRQWRSIIRHPSRQGMLHILLRLVYNCEGTGLDLTDTRLAREMFWACINAATIQNWDRESVEKAYNGAVQLAELMETPKHCGNRKDQATLERFAKYGDPRKQPDVIGVLLMLTAEKAVRVHDGVDVTGSVSQLVQRLLPNMENDPHVSFTTRPEEHPALEADYQLLRWTPVLHGLRLADKILGSSLPEAPAVQRHIRDLEERTEQWRQVVAEATRDQAKSDGFQLYDHVHSR